MQNKTHRRKYLSNYSFSLGLAIMAAIGSIYGKQFIDGGMKLAAIQITLDIVIATITLLALFLLFFIVGLYWNYEEDMASKT